MTQWEYLYIQDWSLKVGKDAKDFATQLNRAGWEGWELVSMVQHTQAAPANQTVTAILKRPVSDEGKRQLNPGV